MQRVCNRSGRVQMSRDPIEGNRKEMMGVTHLDVIAGKRVIKFFYGRGGWYFLSPDRLPVGPYQCERAAAEGAEGLAQVLANLDHSRTLSATIQFAVESYPFKNIPTDPNRSVIECELHRLERAYAESDRRWQELVKRSARPVAQNSEAHELSRFLRFVARQVVALRDKLFQTSGASSFGGRTTTHRERA